MSIDTNNPKPEPHQQKIGIAGNTSLIDQLIKDKGEETEVAKVAKVVIESTNASTEATISK